MEIRVQHLSGEAKGRVEALGDLPLILGRGPECNVRFDPEKEVKVSAKHCEVRELEEGKYEIEDLSRNGTSVNGKQVEGKAPLPNHSTIELGPGGPRVRIDFDDSVGGLSLKRGKDRTTKKQPKVEVRTTVETRVYSQAELDGDDSAAKTAAEKQKVMLAVAIGAGALIVVAIIVAVLLLR